jgi:outer membrane protein assembly complex protein YaeT
MGRFLPVLLLLVTAAASACKTDDTITVHSLTFNGVKAVDPALLRTALATRADTKVPLLNWSLPWSRRRNSFDRGRFDADRKRIEAFYADHGYPDARVSSFDVKLNDKQDAVDVTLTIAEGEPVRVAAVDLRGFEVIPPDHLATLQKQLPVRVGEPRDRQAVLAAHDLAVNELRDHGYPYSRINTEENDGPDGKTATITFTAEPGTLAHFGAIEITGNAGVEETVIRRQLLYKPGELYRRSIVQETQRRLYGMELFQFVNIESLNPEQQNPEVKTKVTVVEGRHQRVNLGVGYGTEEKARVDAAYHHVNFLGGARSAGVHARWSPTYDRGLRLDLTQPYFFAPTLSLGGEGQRWYTFTPAYNSIVSGAKLALTHQRRAGMSWSVSLSSERITSSIEPSVLNDPTLYTDLIALGLDPVTGKQEGTLSAFGVDWQRSTTDNALNARRGYQLGFHAEEAGRLLPGTFNYYAVSIDARHFLPVSKRLVAATRIQLGNVQAAGNDPTQVPFSKKYFLGGASSLRGWGRYEVSPLAGGEPIGGNSLFSFSAEGRLALRGKLGGVLFLDAGNVWTDYRSIDFGTIRYAVGSGLRYETPVGPMRLDFGYQLNPIDGLQVGGAPQLRPWRIHFSIGQAF